LFIFILIISPAATNSKVCWIGRIDIGMNMKNILIGISIFFAPLVVKAQAINNDDPTKRLDTSLMKKFIGVWQWTAGSEAFKLTVERDPISLGDEYKNVFFVNGVMEYKRNGILISEVKNFGKTERCSLSGSVMKPDRYLTFFFSDKTRDRWHKGAMTFTDSTYNFASFKIDPKNQEGMHLIDPKRAIVDTIPSLINVMLHRIN
jgi:hypothetical protein